MTRFERTFDDAAREYDEIRPEYVKALYRDLFAYCPLDKGSRALEIGAGTGRATGPVLDTGCSVTALEPGGNLAALAEARFSSRENFALHRRTLQDFACREEAFDLVYAATAFHWIPQEYGYPRVYALLRRGGTFARFAYHAGPDASRPELMREIQAVYDRVPSLCGGGKAYTEEDAAALAEIARKYGFVDVQYRLYTAKKDFTADEYMKLLRTYPNHMALSEREREMLFDGVRRAIERCGSVITVHYVFDMQLARKP